MRVPSTSISKSFASKYELRELRDLNTGLLPNFPSVSIVYSNNCLYISFCLGMQKEKKIKEKNKDTYFEHMYVGVGGVYVYKQVCKQMDVSLWTYAFVSCLPSFQGLPYLIIRLFFWYSARSENTTALYLLYYSVLRDSSLFTRPVPVILRGKQRTQRVGRSLH